MSPTELAEYKKSEATRIRALKKEKKDAQKKAVAAVLDITLGTLNSFKTHQSYSKALSKVKGYKMITSQIVPSKARAFCSSLLCAIIACSHLPFFKIFSNFVHFCPNFQIFCPFLPILNIFMPFFALFLKYYTHALTF